MNINCINSFFSVDFQMSQIDCYDHDDDGSHDLIGIANTSLRQLIEIKQSGVRLDCACSKTMATQR